jgi:RNA polymerase-binding transcription factor DksA
MDEIRQRLEHDLNAAMSRLRRLDGGVGVEELSRSIGSNCALADEVDEIQASERREIGFATRELLVGRVNRLSAALDRLSRGQYGTCVECEEPISAARLRAAPDVQTCVRCQDRLERRGGAVAREAMELEWEEA